MKFYGLVLINLLPQKQISYSLSFHILTSVCVCVCVCVCVVVSQNKIIENTMTDNIQISKVRHNFNLFLFLKMDIEYTWIL